MTAILPQLEKTVTMLKNVELALAEFYITCASLFPEERTLWELKVYRNRER